MELGIGVGWVREEAEALGTNFADRGTRADEYIDVMRTLWREPVASFAGAYVRFDRVVSRPTPVQPGGVPIVVGGHSSAAARRAGRVGDGFFPLGVSEQRLHELRRMVTHAAEAAGREANAIALTLLGGSDLRSAERCARLGAERMVVAALQPDLDGVRRWLDGFQRDVMERM